MCLYLQHLHTNSQLKLEWSGCTCELNFNTSYDFEPNQAGKNAPFLLTTKLKICCLYATVKNHLFWISKKRWHNSNRRFVMVQWPKQLVGNDRWLHTSGCSTAKSKAMVPPNDAPTSTTGRPIVAFQNSNICSRICFGPKGSDGSLVYALTSVYPALHNNKD